MKVDRWSVAVWNTVLLLCVVHRANSQAPAGPCIDTGPRCYNDCSSNPGQGEHQWCGACNWYLTCVGTVTYYRPCPGAQIWNDVSKACLLSSSTCFECLIYKPSPSASPASTTPHPIERQCESTGPMCLEACQETIGGNYQWCARCDYFLQCSSGQTYYTQCQPGLVYDQRLQRCDFQSTTCSCQGRI